jgi:hypothetical protein
MFLTAAGKADDSRDANGSGMTYQEVSYEPEYLGACRCSADRGSRDRDPRGDASSPLNRKREPGAAGARQASPSLAKVVAFQEAMDRLWTDHVTWTRLVIIDFDANAPDLKPDLARLLRNQADIGRAIKPYYGAAAGSKLTRLLHTHIMEAVSVLAAAKAANKAKLAAAQKAWHTNAHRSRRS